MPIPWTADAPAYGFSPTGDAWLPQPAEWAHLARDVQAGDDASTLSLYRALIAARRERGLGAGALEWLEGFGTEVVAFRNGDVTVIGNTGATAIPLPEGIVIAASGPVSSGELPADTTVWLADD